jgi:arylsulfatase A-like enzyme
MRQYSAWKARTNSTSHDAFLAECAIACMKAFSPDIVAVCFGEIDCAHYRSWSRYVEAIRRTDALTGRLWETVQGLEEYRNRTLMLILPDHGRELESSGGLGFVHHSDFYTGQGADEGCRRVWMLGIGPGLPANQTVEKPLPITAVAATGLEFMGLRASPGAATSVWGL